MSENKIIEALTKNAQAMKSAEIAVATGIEKKEIDKLIKKLVVEEKVYSPKRCFYDIKK